VLFRSQMINSQDTLNKRYLELTELRHVLRETSTFFDTQARMHSQDDLHYHEEQSLLDAASPVPRDDSIDAPSARAAGSSSLNFVAGVILRQRMGIFERILFRALRGNLYMNFAEIGESIIDPATDEPVKKNVFCIFAHGKELIAKIKKICESLGATLYPVDERSDKRRLDALEVISRIEDLKQVLDNTKNARRVELGRVAEVSEVWSNIIVREKAIYYTMNKFSGDAQRHSLIAEGWCPTHAISQIKSALSGVTERTGSSIPPIFNESATQRTPPTYHVLNKFTRGFQEIVDAYGIASYQEVNPGLFTTITFPFLFAVMFGDFGHGIVMSIFAAWMVINESKLSKKDWGEIWEMFFGGRYIILLMGLFSIYTGLIYNDVFSRAFNMFGSGWEFKMSNASGVEKWYGHSTGNTYIFGIDPAWHNSDNNLLFSNSYKMKMAIVFGVMQMTLGIVLNVFNYVHFNKKRSIYTEFIPQITFLMSIFGYLVLLIFYKWFSNWENASPPGLLNTLIYMFLSPGKVDPKDQLYPGQGPIQVLLILIAFCCVPVMLFAKPYFEYRDHHRATEMGYAGVAVRASIESSRPSTDSEAPQIEGMHEEEHFDFGEIMVHQVIHTIEFCLNAISNTASYLRLWALSLAHAQLSEVLWDMVLNQAITMTPSWFMPIALVIAFYFWFSATVAILIVMEGLSAFLHALRLHWVEFQGKFYMGRGIKFDPFSFRTLGDA